MTKEPDGSWLGMSFPTTGSLSDIPETDPNAWVSLERGELDRLRERERDAVAYEQSHGWVSAQVFDKVSKENARLWALLSEWKVKEMVIEDKALVSAVERLPEGTGFANEDNAQIETDGRGGFSISREVLLCQLRWGKRWREVWFK